MLDWQLKTPVAFLVFNRPDTTEKVFEAIRQAKPPRLLVVADGPRTNKPGEAEKCAAVRTIIERVDWDCEVLKNYADENMGCKRRVSSGLDWIFSKTEEVIILEDDCLPDLTFFRYCEELLEKYRYDTRVMMISGANVLGEWKADIQSYCFSYFGSIWGWASWRRAWSYYDVEMKLWADPEVKTRIRDIVADPKRYPAVQKLFDSVYSGEVDTWDFQWFYTRLLQSGLSIIPARNLVSNLGFGAEGTHNKNSDDPRANMSLEPMVFPLEPPRGMAADRDYDDERYRRFWKKKSILQRAVRKLKRTLSR
ncbi:MAG: glycosyltransferase family 2 protein [Cyanobacteria bacterium RM1_2_2]|nr:glycosyltransferase family 2 protein [Cyanobacteria bacterium RM1_2_2]